MRLGELRYFASDHTASVDERLSWLHFWARCSHQAVSSVVTLCSNIPVLLDPAEVCWAVFFHTEWLRIAKPLEPLCFSQISSLLLHSWLIPLGSVCFVFAPGHLSPVEGNQKTEKFGDTLNSHWPTSAELSAWPKQFYCFSVVSCSMQKISEPSKDFFTFSRYLICPSSLLLSTDDPSFCFMEKINAIRYKFCQLSCQHSHSNFLSAALKWKSYFVENIQYINCILCIVCIDMNKPN